MRVLLVQPELNYGHQMPDTPSMALLILGTLAQRRGHVVQILHQANGQFTEDLESFKPDIVGITVNTFQVKYAEKIAREAKAYGAQVVIGGPHAGAWNGTLVDKGVIGEGENLRNDLSRRFSSSTFCKASRFIDSESRSTRRSSARSRVSRMSVNPLCRRRTGASRSPSSR